MHLLDISYDNSITKIILSKRSICAKSNIHHILHIEEIANGIILLNDNSKTISTKRIICKLNGTFIINFDNATIKINNKIYQNVEVN